MKTHTKTLLASLAMIGSACAVSADTIQVDIGAGVGGRADKEPLPQAGWEEWQTPDFNSTGSFSTTFAFADTTGGTLGASLATTTNAGARLYGIDGVSDPGNLTLHNMWSDLFFFNNNKAGSLTLTLDNLVAGVYEITTYHFADELAEGSGADDFGIADISVNGTDTGLNAELLGTSNGGEPVFAADVEATAVTIGFTVANDGDTVNILYDGLADNDGGDSFGINGFELTLVPEPSSLALLSIGGLLIARRRRG